jgi:hypothetical protein
MEERAEMVSGMARTEAAAVNISSGNPRRHNPASDNRGGRKRTFAKVTRIRER